MTDPIIDRTREKYCWNHSLNLENKHIPTRADRKKLAEIELRPFKTIKPDGSVVMGRTCHKCFNTVYTSLTKALAKPGGLAHA